MAWYNESSDHCSNCDYKNVQIKRLKEAIEEIVEARMALQRDIGEWKERYEGASKTSRELRQEIQQLKAENEKLLAMNNSNIELIQEEVNKRLDVIKENQRLREELNEVTKAEEIMKTLDEDQVWSLLHSIVLSAQKALEE